jgi:hypothetical protein
MSLAQQRLPAGASIAMTGLGAGPNTRQTSVIDAEGSQSGRGLLSGISHPARAARTALPFEIAVQNINTQLSFVAKALICIPQVLVFAVPCGPAKLGTYSPLNLLNQLFHSSSAFARQKNSGVSGELPKVLKMFQRRI